MSSRRFIFSFLLLFCVVFSGRLQAGMMVPDFSVGPVAGFYNSGDSSIIAPGWGLIAANSLSVRGAVTELNFGPTSDSVGVHFATGARFPLRLPGLLKLNAAIDSALTGPQVASSQDGFGDFSILGTLGDPAVDANVVLLQGTLTEAIQSDSAAGSLTFLADIDTDSTGAFGVGSEVRIDLNPNVAFNIFASPLRFQSFSSGRVGRPVPEPASVTAWALGFVGFGMLQCIRRRRVNV